MNKKGIIWEETKNIILAAVALVILILLIYFLRNRLKEYVEIIKDFLRL